MTLLTGIVAILLGITFIELSIYLQRGSYVSYSDTTMAGFLLAGIGLGYLICSKTIYSIEKKSQK